MCKAFKLTLTMLNLLVSSSDNFANSLDPDQALQTREVEPGTPGYKEECGLSTAPFVCMVCGFSYGHVETVS